MLNRWTDRMRVLILIVRRMEMGENSGVWDDACLLVSSSSDSREGTDGEVRVKMVRGGEKGVDMLNTHDAQGEKFFQTKTKTKRRKSKRKTMQRGGEG